MEVPVLTLVSIDLCPYVQRASIALTEKGVPFERRTVDLAARPAWFTAISPPGQVPLVDAVFAPIFRYFDVFDRFVELGSFEGLVKVPRWRRALVDRPSVKGAVVYDYEKKLEAFLRRQKSHLATLMA